MMRQFFSFAANGIAPRAGWRGLLRLAARTLLLGAPLLILMFAPLSALPAEPHDAAAAAANAGREAAPPAVIRVAQAERCAAGQRWNGSRCVRVTLLPLPRDGCQRGFWRSEDHCCPLGKGWNGSRCATHTNAQGRPECPFRTSGTYPDCVPTPAGSGECLPAEPGKTPACCPAGARFADDGRCVKVGEADEGKDCGAGLYSSEGHCCPRGTIWNGKRCLRNAGLQPSCPRGTIGIFPDCHEPGSPVLRQPCPSGTTGTFPNCVSARNCPAGMVGAPPNCRTIEVQTCPAGTRGRYPNCSPIVRVCPPGTTGVPPVCRRLGGAPCPAGSVSSGGRCIILQPPRATIQPRQPSPIELQRQRSGGAVR